MPRPSLRTRNKKRHQLRLPGGKVGKHYRRKKINSSSCSMCGRELSSIPRLIPSKIRKIPANQRNPERLYSSQLCSDCMQRLLKDAVRSA